MTESAGERTEQATPKREKEAREKGQVARSKELTTALLLMVASLSIYAFSNGIASDVGQIAQRAFTPGIKDIFEPKMMLQALYESFTAVMLALAPLFIMLFLIGLVSPLASGGLAFSGKAIAPNEQAIASQWL